MSDAISFLDRLTSAEIRAELAKLSSRQKQLRILLRSVVAREKAASRIDAPRQESEAARAS